MVQNTVAKVSTYSLTKIAISGPVLLKTGLMDCNLELNGIPLTCALVGKFNASNLLAYIWCAMLLGEDQDQY
jgi:UDP-N-acetylmuramoyl-L-alanyl-D-glutamate--2,6-diaminopimelate ligase